jgi:hypothetical protein
MDLLGCSHCGRRFYLPGVVPSGSRCWPRGAPLVTVMAERDGIPSKG